MTDVRPTVANFDLGADQAATKQPAEYLEFLSNVPALNCGIHFAAGSTDMQSPHDDDGSTWPAAKGADAPDNAELRGPRFAALRRRHHRTLVLLRSRRI